MALPHAQPLDVIDVHPTASGPALAQAPSTSLIKTAQMQLLHLVLPAHHDTPSHHVDQECTLHCLRGRVEVVMPGGVRTLQAGQLVLLPAGQAHSLRAREDSTVLATLRLRAGDTGDGTGRAPDQGEDDA